MNHCTQCGAELGDVRFCTNCGQPFAADEAELESWRTDTAERPRAAVPAAPSTTADPAPTVTREPVVPPPASSRAEPARFPLFADETGTGELPSYAGPAAAPPVRDDDDRPGAAGWLPWVVGLAVLVLVAGFGFWLLTGDDGATDPENATATEQVREPTREPEPSDTPSASPTEAETTPAQEPDGPTDLARFAAVDAPPPAAPGQDNSGNVVRYVATNMVDGVPETTWRTAGDATGSTITFTFAEPTRLSELGLINGYAKVGQDGQGILDWYHGNRRVLSVEWVLDDGTTVSQDLDDTTIVQTVAVKKVETQTVRLRLLEVSPPGKGRASRDYTAISDVRLFGTTT